MKIPSLIALAGLVIGFIVPTFAQQKDTGDQELRQVADSLARKLDEAWNNNDAAAAAALYTEDGFTRLFTKHLTVGRPSKKLCT